MVDSPAMPFPFLAHPSSSLELLLVLICLVASLPAIIALGLRRKRTPPRRLQIVLAIASIVLGAPLLENLSPSRGVSFVVKVVVVAPIVLGLIALGAIEPKRSK